MSYFVYILASGKHGTLYIGVCNDMRARLELHRTGKGSKFVKKYGVMRLVYMEEYATALEAIQREKQMKEWRRDWKIRRIEETIRTGGICPTCYEYSWLWAPAFAGATRVFALVRRRTGKQVDHHHA